MSARVDAAAKAWVARHSQPGSWTLEQNLDAALAAADSVMFSEAAIERVAKLLCAANNLGLDYWERYPDDSLIKEKFRDQARAVVAALREGA